jgi:hypothetical protein
MNLGEKAYIQLRMQLRELINAFYTAADMRGMDPLAAAVFVNSAMIELCIRTGRSVACNIAGSEVPFDSPQLSEGLKNSIDEMIGTIMKQGEK